MYLSYAPELPSVAQLEVIRTQGPSPAHYSTAQRALIDSLGGVSELPTTVDITPTKVKTAWYKPATTTALTCRWTQHITGEPRACVVKKISGPWWFRTHTYEIQSEDGYPITYAKYAVTHNADAAENARVHIPRESLIKSATGFLLTVPAGQNTGAWIAAAWEGIAYLHG